MKKKKPKPRVRTFKLVNYTWQYALFVRTGGTRDQALEWFKRKFCGEEPAEKNTTNGTAFYLIEERSHLIWLREFPPPGGIVAHEALHSVKHVLQHAGLGPMNDDTEEAYAYLLQWTVHEIGRRVW